MTKPFYTQGRPSSKPLWGTAHSQQHGQPWSTPRRRSHTRQEPPVTASGAVNVAGPSPGLGSRVEPRGCFPGHPGVSCLLTGQPSACAQAQLSLPQAPAPATSPVPGVEDFTCRLTDSTTGVTCAGAAEPSPRAAHDQQHDPGCVELLYPKLTIRQLIHVRCAGALSLSQAHTWHGVQQPDDDLPTMHRCRRG